jgi:methyl-accepting chemotaxis protein
MAHKNSTHAMNGVSDNNDLLGQIAAINRSQAVIEFELDGTIIKANDNFLKTLGYSLEEVQGKHHSMFVDSVLKGSAEYKNLWAKLNEGEFQAGEFKRLGKGEKEIWIQASYNPIFDSNNKPYKVVKFAYNITNQKLQNADYQGQLAAISKSQAVIEFNLDGTILTANDNFLNALGYSLAEVKGKYHSMFVEQSYGKSSEYREFWSNLNKGLFQSGEFKRFGKGGKEVWIQASYNPILDFNGKPFKVVKYATDVTAQVKMRALLSDTMEGVSRNAQSLAASSSQLINISQLMGANAEETSNQAITVSAAAEQVSANVQTVAAGVEQMTASVSEISKNATEAANVTTKAVKVAEATNATISKLGLSSVEIGKVIKVITSIAEQTNLLALNATIEAARAGEAGKGFAVVANEVKELAKETAKATEEIGTKIETIQVDTKDAVTAIEEISGIINKINDISNTIASAVEEQTATTSEISRNISEAAKGSSEIAQNISGVATAAKSTSVGASDTQDASAALAKMSSELQQLVTQANMGEAAH